MITDDMIIYLLFQMMFLMLALLSYTKIPYLGIIVAIGVFATSYQTIVAFGEYWMEGIILILSNMMILILGYNKAMRGN